MSAPEPLTEAQVSARASGCAEAVLGCVGTPAAAAAADLEAGTDEELLALLGDIRVGHAVTEDVSAQLYALRLRVWQVCRSRSITRPVLAQHSGVTVDAFDQAMTKERRRGRR